MKIVNGWIAEQTGLMGRPCIGIASSKEAAMTECQRQLELQREEAKAFALEYEQDQRATALSLEIEGNAQ